MPYVKADRREYIAPEIPAVVLDPGELNYQLTRIVLQYVEDHGLSYRTLNDVLGALEGAKLEFYRRVAAPYEDSKAKENGDVYPGFTTSRP